MEFERIMELLGKKLEDLTKEASLRDFDGGAFRAWVQDVEAILIRGLGEGGKRMIAHFLRTARNLPMPDTIIDPGYREEMFRRRFESKLPEVEAVLRSIIWELETFGLPEPNEELQEGKAMPRVFISHGGALEDLGILEEFLRAIGIDSLVVEERPSMGLDVNDKVDYYLNQAECAIILATADKTIIGKLQPRQNVIHETGLAQKTLGRKIIYLLEKGVEFPSNIAPKTWIGFEQGNIERTFIQIIRELRAFGLVEAKRPSCAEEESNS